MLNIIAPGSIANTKAKVSRSQLDRFLTILVFLSLMEKDILYYE